ncbi:hypothetical protein [Streptomyces venezuelae]|uniref:hypothetical protein n=1 Tax=Streptomyces venezuelae TaxID=54571 RepID=UPI0033200F93
MMDTGQSTTQLPARVAWDEAGTVIVPNVLKNTRFEDIVAEAHDRAELVTPHIHEHTAAHRDGSFASPVHCGFIPPGPALEGLAFDKELLAALREATGIPRLIPRGGAVVLYEKGGTPLATCQTATPTRSSSTPGALTPRSAPR